MKMKTVLHYIGLQLAGYLGLYIGFRLKPEQIYIPAVPSEVDSNLIYYIEMHGFFIAAILGTLFVIIVARLLKKTIIPAFISIIITCLTPHIYYYLDTGLWMLFSFKAFWGYLIGVIFTIGLFCLLENTVALFPLGARKSETKASKPR